jgi:hypothetical protein
MTDCECLLRQARSVLDRYMFDGDTIRDDVAEVCMKIDDALPMNEQRAAMSAPIEVAA